MAFDSPNCFFCLLCRWPLDASYGCGPWKRPCCCTSTFCTHHSCTGIYAVFAPSMVSSIRASLPAWKMRTIHLRMLLLLEAWGSACHPGAQLSCDPSSHIHADRSCILQSLHICYTAYRCACHAFPTGAWSSQHAGSAGHFCRWINCNADIVHELYPPQTIHQNPSCVANVCVSVPLSLLKCICDHFSWHISN